MKWASTLLAALLILAGGIFALQGLNVLLGSFMSGSTLWLYIGVAMLLIGLAVLFLANRRPRPP